MTEENGFAEFKGIYVSAPKYADFKGIRKTLKELEPALRSNGAPQRVVLDMTPIQRCSATGITILAAAMQHLHRSKRLSKGSEIRPPDKLWIRRYIEDMEFFDALGVRLDQGGPAQRRSGTWPVTRVSNEKESARLTRTVLEHVPQFQKMHLESRGALASCVNEMAENVFNHATSPIDALIAAQASPRTKKGELVIADTGRGIREALAADPAYRDAVPDDYAAIKLALNLNVSRLEDRARGIGLWLVSQLARQNGGQMLILSNEGGIDIVGTQEERVDGYFWPGTLVAIEFDLTRPIRTKEVYDSGDFPDDDAFEYD